MGNKFCRCVIENYINDCSYSTVKRSEDEDYTTTTTYYDHCSNCNKTYIKTVITDYSCCYVKRINYEHCCHCNDSYIVNSTINTFGKSYCANNDGGIGCAFCYCGTCYCNSCCNCINNYDLYCFCCAFMVMPVFLCLIPCKHGATIVDNEYNYTLHYCNKCNNRTNVASLMNNKNENVCNKCLNSYSEDQNHCSKCCATFNKNLQHCKDCCSTYNNDHNHCDGCCKTYNSEKLNHCKICHSCYNLKCNSCPSCFGKQATPTKNPFCTIKEEDICPICMDEIIDEKYITNCNHVFHKKCLKEWESHNLSCPLCRNAL